MAEVWLISRQREQLGFNWLFILRSKSSFEDGLATGLRIWPFHPKVLSLWRTEKKKAEVCEAWRGVRSVFRSDVRAHYLQECCLSGVSEGQRKWNASVRCASSAILELIETRSLQVSADKDLWCEGAGQEPTPTSHYRETGKELDNINEAVFF